MSDNPLIENKKISSDKASLLSVAPMMDWTDRHCRYFHRQISRCALLYTEMVTSAALVRGGALHLLGHDPAEAPVALQLGGSEPGELARAARMGAEAGYAEINLNVGCPSDRVQSGCFGAVLMKTPTLVGDCVTAMAGAVPGVEITVKCRIGVDDQDPREILPAFLETMQAAGVRRVIVHARKAWLQGLSPKENREVPPLDYALVAAMVPRFPELAIIVNGGIGSLPEARAMMASGFAGVMFGRAAYHNPWDILSGVDEAMLGAPSAHRSRADVVQAMRPYIARHLAAGGRLNSVTRHMMGLFAGCPGARNWRRALSERATAAGAGLEVLDAALALVAPDTHGGAAG